MCESMLLREAPRAPPTIGPEHCCTANMSFPLAGYSRAICNETWSFTFIILAGFLHRLPVEWQMFLSCRSFPRIVTGELGARIDSPSRASPAAFKLCIPLD